MKPPPHTRHTVLVTLPHSPRRLLALPACRRSEPAPSRLADVFPPVTVELATFSSPALADLDRDGVEDIVFGSGGDRTMPAEGRYYFAKEPDPAGYVTAVSGATGKQLWKAGHTGDAHTVPVFADLNRDSVPDVFMGGREAAFAAFSGVDGKVLWRMQRAALPVTPEPYNFFTPVLIGDRNGDAVPDVAVVYGGDDTRLPGTPRDPAFVLVVSGADGAVLATHRTPDGKESYQGLVTCRRPDGKDWLYYATGGETDGGTAYRVPVDALMDGTFTARSERLVAPGEAKGVMAPPTLVELTGDNDPDILVSTFDGRLIALSGATGKTLWEHQTSGEESYHQPAVVRIERNGRLGLLLSRGIGIFPQYKGSVHRLFDARTGEVMYEYRDEFSPGGAPLAADLTGGIDELIFFSVRYPRAQAARIYILHAPSKTLIAHDVPVNLTTTPVIADPRHTGKLELIGVAWLITPGEGTPDWHRLRTQLVRLDLNVPTPKYLTWSQYMGTGRDGRYRPPPASAAQ
jgi:outer membrane protein assembly factor BamB